MSNFKLTVTKDEALVLSELLGHLADADRLEFAHRAEFFVLQGLAGQLKMAGVGIAANDYAGILAEARRCVADGYEHDPNQSAFDGF